MLASARQLVFCVAESDCAQQELLQEVLPLLFSCTVVTAPDMPTALAQARQTKPHLLLLDDYLPPTGGGTLLSAWQGDPLLRDIPVLLLSTTPAQMWSAEPAGAVPWLAKPYDLADLEQAIRLLLPNCPAGSPPA